MVADSDPGNDAMLDNVWNIFYHFYLDKVSLNRLLDQCRKLVDMSITVESWSSSKYGGVFRFCTDASLLQIRNMWIKYLETETLSHSEKKALSSSFSAGMKDVLRTQKDVSTSYRSAGPLWLNLKSMGADHFDKFWTTGTTSKPASHINPTFAYSLSCWNIGKLCEHAQCARSSDSRYILHLDCFSGYFSIIPFYFVAYNIYTKACTVVTHPFASVPPPETTGNLFSFVLITRTIYA
jgi:hypothetical protein